MDFIFLDRIGLGFWDRIDRLGCRLVALLDRISPLGRISSRIYRIDFALGMGLTWLRFWDRIGFVFLTGLASVF